MSQPPPDRDSESRRTRIEWDGTQFLPELVTTDEALPEMPATAPSALLAVLAFVVGFVIFGSSLLLLVLLGMPKDATGAELLAAVIAVGAGLMLWCPIELSRIKPLSGRIRDLALAERLSHTLHFTNSELGLNRSGRLSIMQRLHLFGFDLGWWLVVLACLGLPAALLALRGWNDPVKDIRALFFVVLGLYAAWKAGATLLDAMGGRVRSELTSLRPILWPGNWVTDLLRNWTDTTVHYAFEGTGALTFEVSRSAYEALTPDRQYRVYFTPMSKRLMSLEPGD
jgi:hypothetical protein